MYKSFSLGSHDPVTDEPRAHVVDPGCSYLEKTATDVQNFVVELKPVPGKTILHVIAMGSYEYYGPNRNKDGFAEHHQGDDASLHLPKVAIHDDYNGLVEPWNGKPVYKSFSDAHAFMHHKNKDPNKRIGDVLMPFYNDDMHRVELILSLNNDKCSRFVDKVNRGEDLAFSMGCHIKYDVCSVCGNRAPSRRDYCEHARNMHRREFDDHGAPICVFNPNARFFDISIVWRPADRIGFMLKKVANEERPLSVDEGLGVLDYNARIACANKFGEMDKVVTGDVDVTEVPPSVEVSLKLLKDDSTDAEKESAPISKLAEYGISAVLKTAWDRSTALSVGEVVDLISRRTESIELPQSLLSKCAEFRRAAYSVLADNPQFIDDIVGTGLFSGAYSDKVAELLEDTEAQRSCKKDALLKRAYERNKTSTVRNSRGYMPLGTGQNARSEVFHVQQGDDILKTTRSHAQEAALTGKAGVLAKMVGAGLLAASVYRMLTGTGGPGAGLAGAGSVGLLDWVSRNKALPFGDYMKTMEGEVIRTDTPLFKDASLLLAVKGAIMDAKEASFNTQEFTVGSSGTTFDKVSEDLGKAILRSFLADRKSLI